jgi:hypothetical protein
MPGCGEWSPRSNERRPEVRAACGAPRFRADVAEHRNLWRDRRDESRRCAVQTGAYVELDAPRASLRRIARDALPAGEEWVVVMKGSSIYGIDGGHLV